LFKAAAKSVLIFENVAVGFHVINHKLK